jgi:outer membrane lipoprotein-sorting protein
MPREPFSPLITLFCAKEDDMTNRDLNVKKIALVLTGLCLPLSAPAFAQAVAPSSTETKPTAPPQSEQKTLEPNSAAPGAQESKPTQASESGDPKASENKKGVKASKSPLQLGKKNSAPPKPMERGEAVKRADAFFNSSPVMTADFVQIGADGKRSEGKLYVQRAGRVRFEYAQPATMEVVADGVQVAVRDRKLNTQDLYFIAQTPLKFLMKEKIDLEKDVTVQDVTTDDAGVTIFIEDKVTFGGTSHLRLIFDPKNFTLKQWQVKDPQGYETLISLFNIDQTKTPDPELFKITK